MTTERIFAVVLVVLFFGLAVVMAQMLPVLWHYQNEPVPACPFCGASHSHAHGVMIEGAQTKVEVLWIAKADAGKPLIIRGDGTIGEPPSIGVGRDTGVEVKP